MNRRSFLFTSATLAAFSKISFAQANPAPTDNATIVVGFSAGGAGDLAARVAAEHVKLTDSYPVGVEFRPGAGGTIATDQIRRAKADGTVLSLYSASPLLVAPHLQSLPYDPLRDFSYIAAYSNIAIPAFVRTDSPFKEWPDLIKFGRDNPGKLRWATAAPRGIGHIATEAAFRKEGVTAAFVPFSGGADAITALLGGHIDMVVSSDFAAHLKAGKVRLLVETGPEPVSGHPDVPTFKQLGYPLSVASAYGLFGPAKLPAQVLQYWQDSLRVMTRTVLYKRFLETLGGQATFQEGQAFHEEIARNYREIGKQIELLGLRP
ncbi:MULTISPECIES: tripartite tricarboxylate transporter substrate binding protein [unclassified Ensifer]|uniref:Bug family tripartite tricarboxylate transporter substrate binding protein n=1 Tax=unclassified Ensifer TaxID=2633371 RepID=UPI0007111186|nr:MULTISPECIES: tripartite tricarboxylate transporter substrate binding protein [unclassified Ensifer]KQW41302.1 hypothetical protein ASD02_36110 [Ensifer sp. Root1252]KRC62240.1 hypothetical protein ASE32_36200 [Ensifer sp. Root231]KRC91139.1 hypothetical protein ASE47_36170 [Ensifer sp. Root258]